MSRKQLILFFAPLLVIAAWFGILSTWTEASYVCLDCGRTERQKHLLVLPIGSTLIADGEDYARRFPFAVPAQHSHRWHLDGCIRSLRGVACTMQYAEGWFRVLPQLRDRAAADELVREELSLPEDARIGLMQELTQFLWVRSLEPDALDQAFADWRARRRTPR